MELSLKQLLPYLPQLGVALLIWLTALSIVRVIYNLYFHPLRNFPGPVLARSTVLWRLSKILKGDLPQIVRALHETYGPVVRIAPFELSFVSSSAWKDIYGHHNGFEMSKDDKFYRPLGKHVPDHIINADKEKHARLRRQLAHGFSERSMRGQEPVFRQYVDLLITRLEERSKRGEVVDMRSWFNFTTFDVIGNLAFGSDFGCLEGSHYHPWVDAINNDLISGGKMRVAFELMNSNMVYLLDKFGLFKGRRENVAYTESKIRERLALDVERPDFIEGLLKKKDIIDEREVRGTAQVLVVAGSETTATLLSGAMYLLGTNPDALQKVTDEVRGAFKSEEEINLLSVNNLEYMLACLDETFRLYPPVPSGLPRIVPKGGANIAGHYVPQDTSVSVWQLAAYHNSSNFTKPTEYHPERFLRAPEFEKDDIAAVQPFSVGPRNCIGRNLAYAEMRLILARILYKFDVEITPEAYGWIERQKVFTLWDKPALPFHLKIADATDG